MTETLESPIEQIAATAPKEPQTRDEQGKFGARPPEPKANEGIKAAQVETMDGMRDALRTAAGIKLPLETDKAALDTVKPKGKDPEAKTDPASKGDSATAKVKPEPSSKDATRQSEKQLAKARKALELEGLSEETLDGLDDEKMLSLGSHFQEKHSKADREKREAAEAAKKAPAADPGKKPSATASETASEQDDDLSEYVKAADEHFKGFEAETEEGTKAFRTAQAKFVKQGVDRVKAHLEAKLSETVEHLERGLRGESALNRALDRVAIDIPQVDETEVRQKLTSRIAALASDPDTAEEMKRDLRSVIRREAVALGLKDERAEREKTARDELRAAKDAGQPFTGHREAAPEKELDGINMFRGALRDAYSVKRPG